MLGAIFCELSKKSSMVEPKMSAVRTTFYICGKADPSGPNIATSIQVNLPRGLNRWEAINYITGVVAAEVSRYFASECMGGDIPNTQAEFQKPIT